MTHNQPDFVRGSNGGVQRRTLVAGAAWTIPVVATAVGAPLAAASGEAPTLAFTNGPYSVAACGTLNDVVIKATTDGTTAPPAGTLVTVTLSAGLTWPNGDTGARALPTDANGEVVLSGVKATSLGGSRTIGASWAASTASAPVAVTVQNSLAVAWNTNGGTANYPAVPVGSQAVGAEYFLAPNGDLYLQNTRIAQNVTSAAGYFNSGAWTVNYVQSTGATASNTNGSTAAYPAVPAGSTAIGAEYFLAPNGDLYLQNARIAQNVTSAAGYFNSGAWTVNYVQSTGATASNTNGSTAAYPAVPADAVAIGAEYFLTPGGDLYLQNSRVAQNVNSADGYFNNGAWTVNYVQSTGATAWNTNGSTAAYPAVPANAVAIGAEYFLTPGGDLYLQNSRVAQNVASAAGYFNDGAYTVNYIQNPLC